MLNIIFYANASEKTGAGHVMRLLAIAEAFAARGDVEIIFLTKEIPNSLKQKISARQFKVIQAKDCVTSDRLKSLSCDILFVDDYHLSSEEWRVVEGLSATRVVMDDNVSTHNLPVDIVVNAAPNVSECDYRPRTVSKSLCLGPAFTQLRREFSEQAIPELSERNNILVTMGGSDVKQLTLPLCRKLLEALPTVPISVVIGSLNDKAIKELRLLQTENTYLTIYCNVNNMAELMAHSALAISAAGGSLGELASMAVPTIALVCVDNQVAALNADLVDNWYEVFDLRTYDSENGAADINQVCELACCLWHDSSKRLLMSQKARQVVDTLGTSRIVDCVLQTHKKAVRV